MPGWLHRLFGAKAPVPAPLPRKRPSFALPPLMLRADTTLPIVDWDALEQHAPQTDDPKTIDDFWTEVAHRWLACLRDALGQGYGVVESEHFLLLSALDARPNQMLLEYVEKTRRRILMLLDGIAHETEIGKVCILVLRDEDTYYQYVSNYYREDGEYAGSGGMFIQQGYSHFVFTGTEMTYMEPTIAHELTHCLVQHLPLPAWLNEGIAVNTEHHLSPPLGRPFETPEELHQMHLDFWNATTIQEFWSGKSWRRAGDSNKLSYDLATHFVRMAAADYDLFRAFANAADLADAGADASRKCLGHPVEHLAQAVLGEGDWAPDPQRWEEGIEHGQFSTHIA